MPPGIRAVPVELPRAQPHHRRAGRDATVVVEAAARSGSLITAEMAQDLGRLVGAVPGRVTSTGGGGTNALLRDGAALVRGAQDVLDALLGAGVAVTRAAATRRGSSRGCARSSTRLGGGRTPSRPREATGEDPGQGGRRPGRARAARLRPPAPPGGRLCASAPAAADPSASGRMPSSRAPARPVDRRLGLRRRRRHPGRPQGVRPLRRPRDDRDHRHHRPEHRRGRPPSRRSRRA